MAPGVPVLSDELAGTRRIRVRKKRRRRRRLPLVGLLLAALTLAVLVDGAHVYRAVKTLRAGQASLKQAVAALGHAPANWTPGNLSAAAAAQSQAVAAIQAGRDQLEADPLLRLLSAVPLASDQVGAAYHLADAGLGATRALDDGIKFARAYQGLGGLQGPPGPRLLALLGSTSQELQDADRALTPAVEQLRADLRRPLAAPVRGQVQAAVDLLGPRQEQLSTAATASRLVPQLLGGPRPSHYLVLFANPSELRPAGGYVGAAGTLTMDGGRPALAFRGTETYDPPLKHLYPIPYPLDRYLVFQDDSLGIADAGWDPDFPSSARLSEAMYRKATGQAVDGTLQVDPYAVSALLSITGPVEVAGYGSFDAGNFFSKLNFIVNASHTPGSGKGALAPITEEILKRVLSQPVNNYTQILAVLGDQARARHVLAHLHDPAAGALVARAGWNGAVLRPAGDYLMVVDANVGASKGDFFVKRSIAVKVELPAGGPQRHRVILSYDMPAPANATDAELNPFDGGAYHDYLRVYLPENANVAGVSYTLDGRATNDKVDMVGFAHGHEFVGAYARVPRGHKLQLTLDYSVPASGVRTYQLFIQKQAGVTSTPLSVQLSYPGGQYSRTGALEADTGASVRW